MSFMEARHWTELVPGDTYQIQSSGLIQPYFQKVTSLLYQPLIGSTAISLYTTLWSELEENRTLSKQNHHHFLMAVLDIPLREIYRARLKLEAIGLLRTFRSKNSDGPSYVYEIQSPLSPQGFFQDSMLSYFLYRKLGEHHFNRLKDYFRIDPIVDSSSLEEMTRSFHEVFSSSPARAYPVQSHDGQEQWVDIADGTAPKVKPENFSLDIFYGGLSDTFINIDSITPKVEDTVLKLAYVYNLSPLDMQKIILEAVDDDQEINLDELRKAAKSWYELKRGKHLPKLVERENQQNQPNPQQQEKKETKEEKLIRYLSSVSPKQLLTDLAHGREPSKTDLALVESLLVEQGLEPGVVNVLLYNVMLKQDMRLTKSYVQTIAGHWARKNIKTVEEAFAFAKQEHQKVQEKNKTNSRNQNQKKSGRKEVVPEWFEEERNRRNKVATSAAIFEDFDFELERKRLEEELRKK